MKQVIARMLLFGLTAFLPIVLPADTTATVGDDSHWDDQFFLKGIEGTPSPINAVAVADDGTIYAAAYSFVLGPESIAKWNGTTWTALATVPNGPVYSLKIVGSDLYAGGRFTMAGGVAARGIARWDGSNWSQVGSGLSDSSDESPDVTVTSIVVRGSGFFAAGFFPKYGNVAFWDGNSWSAITGGFTGPSTKYVSTMVGDGLNLYVGGRFEYNPGSGLGHVAKWDGSQWTMLGTGLDIEPSALAISGSDLLVLGDITTAGGVAVNNVAKWDGAAWSAFGTEPLDGYFQLGESAMLANGPDVYIASHYLTGPNGITTTKIQKWNGTSWTDHSEFFGGVSFPFIDVLETSGSAILAAGQFQSVGGKAANGIAMNVGGQNWQPLIAISGEGINGNVYSLGPDGADLYIGGDFQIAGGISAFNTAKWDGSSWSGLGPPAAYGTFSSPINAVAASGPDVYVGGSFSLVGNTPASGVAHWNGSYWAAMGLGLGIVTSLAVDGTNVYGNYSGYLGPFDGVKEWSGTNWTGLDKNYEYPSVLTFHNGTLYEGGARHDIYCCHGIGEWTGSQWTSIGQVSESSYRCDPNYCQGSINAMEFGATHMFAAGDFDIISDNLGIISDNLGARDIAKWDGEAWSPFPSTLLDGPVYAMATDNLGHIYLGGDFSGHIAMWDGSTWATLGSGINGTVKTLALLGGDLFAGGTFTMAGSKPSFHIARWRPPAELSSRFALTVDVAPSIGGTCVAQPPPDSDGKYAAGTAVTLITTGTVVGNVFMHWTGDASGTANVIHLTMDADKLITANYHTAVPPPVRYGIAIYISPTGSGYATFDPQPGIDGKFEEKTTITVTAIPTTPGYVFRNWTGDATGTTNPCQIYVTRNMGTTANFGPPLGHFTLTYDISPAGSGSISAKPPPDADGKYTEGTIVILTPTPASSNWLFRAWTGDFASNGYPLYVPILKDTHETATFSPPERFSLTYNVSPARGGSVSVQPPPDPDGKYTERTPVTLTAIPAIPNVTFVGWTGDEITSDNPTMVYMLKDENLTANFLLPPLPDLTLSWSRVSQRCSRNGCTLNLNISVTNQGPVDAPSSNLCIFSSTEDSLDSQSVELKCISTGSVRAGKTVQKRANIRVPSSLSGTFVIGFVDTDDTVFESAESNNEAAFGPLP